MAITKIIRPLPDAPDSSTDSAQVFNTKANAFVSAQKNDFQPDVNAWAVEANQLETDMNAIKTDIDNITGAIPAGTINDGATAIDSVWSSDKTEKEINKHDIVSGKNGNGDYTKFPDGTMMCWGTGKITGGGVSNKDVTLPIAFATDEYTATAVASTSRPDVVQAITILVNTVTQFTVYQDRSSSSDTSFRWQAIGRWK